MDADRDIRRRRHRPPAAVAHLMGRIVLEGKILEDELVMADRAFLGSGHMPS